MQVFSNIDPWKRRNIEFLEKRRGVSCLCILQRYPHLDAIEYWEDMFLEIGLYGIANISWVTGFPGQLASGLPNDRKVISLLIASASFKERVIDVGRLRADLGTDGRLSSLVSSVHQRLTHVETDVECVVRLDIDGKTAVYLLAQLLQEYLRDDMVIMKTKDWIFAGEITPMKFLERLEITSKSSDEEVTMSAHQVRLIAENEGVYLKDRVEIELREILFEASAVRVDW